MGKQPVQALLDTEFAGEWGEESAGSGLRECRVLRATNLTSNGIDYSTAAQRFVPEAKVEMKRLRRGDLILEAAGGGPGVPVGRVARFDPPDEEWRYLVSNFFRTLRPSPNADCRFVFHVLDNLYQQPRIWQVQQQTTGIINLKVRDYLQLRVLVPPLEEQRRIAEILGTITETIQATERVIAKRKRIRAGLAIDLVGGRLGDARLRAWNSTETPDCGYPSQLLPATRLRKRVTCRLADVAVSIIDGPFGSALKTKHYVQDRGVRVVRLANLGEGHYIDDDEAFIDGDYANVLSRHEVRSGDVLVASLGDDNHRPGRACLYPVRACSWNREGRLLSGSAIKFG